MLIELKGLKIEVEMFFFVFFSFMECFISFASFKIRNVRIAAIHSLSTVINDDGRPGGLRRSSRALAGIAGIFSRR